MTVSHLRPLFLLFLALGCAGPVGLPPVSAIDRRAELPALVPDLADRTAARFAAAALVARGERGRPEVARALASLEALDRAIASAEEPPTGLVPVARDLANASLGSHRVYRRASGELLRQPIDPALEARVEQFRDDDPLVLADARIRDAQQTQIARAFNTLAEPAGRSMTSWTLAPYRFGLALVNYAVELYRDEPLPLQRRQALAHWKEHLARHPESPEAEAIRLRVAGAEERWHRTHYERSLRRAKEALDAGDARLALVAADRALRHLPEDPAASALRDRAEERLLAERAAHERSLSAPEDGAAVAPPEARALALALLLPEGDIEGESRRLLDRAGREELADEARFALAVALDERGGADGERSAERKLRRLAGTDANMARHAAALLRSGGTNPYARFEAARRRALSQRSRFILLGPWANGPPERGIPRLLEWPLGVPALTETVMGLPLRLIQLPWLRAPGAEASAARAARRYLALRPEGARAAELHDWLQGYEETRKNWLGVLALAEARETVDEAERAELREKAARQSLELALREHRPGPRLGLLQRVAREFQETEAAREAGLLAREETLDATPQKIRVSRGFLRENPEVAGLAGLALAPALLDGEHWNGELHPEGVAFVGGLDLEVALVAPGRGEDDPPRLVRETLAEAHLARAVALLEETTFRNSLVDPDDALAPDASRDRFFEQARLGRADVVDPRPGAISQFVYRGMRERYGMVRSRESVLPFDLVVQGSFDDLSLGAFPRLRTPRETPDAIFYK